MGENRIVTRQVAELVDRYAAKELRDARQYDNRTPLDEPGIYALHDLAAQIYAHGFSDGQLIAECKHQGQWTRGRDAEAKAGTS
ncbi:hypothetical protein [Mycolicibacter arupensis]|uniref:Uncharacterized protein n=1 Tax=Mycolicibacter arupensis TaxID=342002 RepID=A0A0F5MXG5_9MYCO|nr:hypothetical protein [Mycolicibacter arupensis]KKB99460.1 hypothetical protein WR43_09575 [Mycolicibacter arupensis]MCV7277067.1 hypothetical protein [Mycolicibacter arupensis]